MLARKATTRYSVDPSELDPLTGIRPRVDSIAVKIDTPESMAVHPAREVPDKLNEDDRVAAPGSVGRSRRGTEQALRRGRLKTVGRGSKAAPREMNLNCRAATGFVLMLVLVIVVAPVQRGPIRLVSAAAVARACSRSSARTP